MTLKAKLKQQGSAKLTHCTGAQDCNEVTLNDSVNKLCWRKQAAGWKGALSEPSAVHFHECTCYILIQVTVQSTHCYWPVCFGTGATDLKASYSSSGRRRLFTLMLHPRKRTASSSSEASDFMGHLFSLGRETEGASEDCLDKAAQFALRFLAGCLNRVPVIFNLG